MNITDIRIKLVKKDELKLKAVASVTFDFISMPNKKTPDGGYKDIVHPLNSPTRELIKTAVLEAFRKAEQESEAVTKPEE